MSNISAGLKLNSSSGQISLQGFELVVEMLQISLLPVAILPVRHWRKDEDTLQQQADCLSHQGKIHRTIPYEGKNLKI